MVLNVNINLKIYLTFFLVVIFDFQVESQVASNENVFYVLSDSTKGRSSFQYTTSKKDTIKNGRFEFYHNHFDSLSGILYSTSYKGNYKNNTKDKPWSYSQKELIQSLDKLVKDYEIVRTASGNEFKVSGSFNNGKASGQWNVSQHTILNSKPKDTLVHIELSFLDGKPVGGLSAFNQAVTLKGILDQSARPNGSWVINHKGINPAILEFRTYGEGVLKEHFFMIGQQKVEVIHIGLDMTPDGENESWEDFTVGKDYFNILSFTRAGFQKKKTVEVNEATLELLLSNSDILFNEALTRFGNFKGLNFWQLLEGSESIVYPTFKVRKFPFQQVESKQIDSIIQKIKNIDSTLEHFFENPFLEINLYRYNDLSSYFAMMVLHKNELEKWLQLSRKIENPSFEYINRSEVFNFILPEINYPKNVIYRFQEDEFEKEFPFSMNNHQVLKQWQDVLVFLQAKEKSILDLVSNSNKILDQVKKQSELNILEKDLVKSRDTLMNLFSFESQREDFNQYHKRLTPSVRDFTEAKFKEYASLSLEEKKSTIDNYLECFDDLVIVYDKLSDLPRKVSRLDELYTRTTFNPYLMSNMDERVKSRVYEAYEKYLLPFFLIEIESIIDCKQILNRARNIEMLYSKMLEIRETDTRQMERELRRVKAPTELIEIFNLKVY